MEKISILIVLLILCCCGRSTSNHVIEKKPEPTNSNISNIESKTVDADSLYEIGARILNEDAEKSDYDFAHEILNKAVEFGSSDAMTLLGVELLYGYRFNKDLKRGNALLQQAVDINNSWAMREMAYYRWSLLEYNQAISFLHEALLQEDKYAAFDLVNVYLSGRPYYNGRLLVNKDVLNKIKGIEILNLASQLGNSDADILLGGFYLRGYYDLIQINEEKAKLLFKKAYNNIEVINTPGGRDNIEDILQEEIGSNWKEWLELGD
jgi:TPR repeat protein